MEQPAEKNDNQPQPPAPVEEDKNELVESTSAMFRHLGEYLKGELEGTTEDFKLLETMNIITKEKYAEMTTNAKGLNAFMENLQEKYKEFEPYCRQIEQIDGNVTELEKTVQLLDDYTKRLEEKFKKLAAQKKEAAKKAKLAAQQQQQPQKAF